MRLPDWQQRFSDFGKARASMPFEWGSNDCCTFAAAAMEALTGRNPMASFESYGTSRGMRRQALRRLFRRMEKAGGLGAFAHQQLGPSSPPLFAAVGDVVLVMNEGREMLGICNGVNLMAPGSLGMVTLGMNAALAAWKI
jgi:hypothetical protein